MLFFFATIQKYSVVPGCFAMVASLFSGARGKGQLRPLGVCGSIEWDASETLLGKSPAQHKQHEPAQKQGTWGCLPHICSFRWVSTEECNPEESSLNYTSTVIDRLLEQEWPVIFHVWQEISHILCDQSTGAKTKISLRQVNGGPKVFCWCHCCLLLQKTRWCYQKGRVKTFLSTCMNAMPGFTTRVPQCAHRSWERHKISGVLAHYWPLMTSKRTWLESLIFSSSWKPVIAGSSTWHLWDCLWSTVPSFMDSKETPKPLIPLQPRI